MALKIKMSSSTEPSNQINYITEIITLEEPEEIKPEFAEEDLIWSLLAKMRR